MAYSSRRIRWRVLFVLRSTLSEGRRQALVIHWDFNQVRSKMVSCTSARRPSQRREDNEWVVLVSICLFVYFSKFCLVSSYEKVFVSNNSSFVKCKRNKSRIQNKRNQIKPKKHNSKMDFQFNSVFLLLFFSLPLYWCTLLSDSIHKWKDRINRYSWKKQNTWYFAMNFSW